ncbi:MAG: hypothetical protein QXL17_08200 [Candidatus Thermoplasmatota archaeon]
MDTTAISTEERLKNRYSKISKIVFIIAILYLFWVCFVMLSIYFFGYGYRWAFVTIDLWILSAIVLLCFFVVLEIFFLGHIIKIRKKRLFAEIPKPVIIEGRPVYVYTIPEGASGGLFSKTLIPLDDSMMVMIRFQMLKPHDLWKKDNNKVQ